MFYYLESCCFHKFFSSVKCFAFIGVVLNLLFFYPQLCLQPYFMQPANGVINIIITKIFVCLLGRWCLVSVEICCSGTLLPVEIANLLWCL